MKKILNILLTTLLVLTLVSCRQKSKDVIIVYTSDVHGKAYENIGYAGVLSFKQEALKKTPYVALIDAGDSFTDSAYAQSSKGEAIVECMNAVGYNYMSIGNHTFDFGLERFGEIIEETNGQYLNTNIVYIGESGIGSYLNELSKYDIVDYGGLKVGYIAIDTPSTAIDTNPTKIKENGEYVLDFYFNDVSDNFFSNFQKLIDEMKQKGADKIICISHLGYGEDYKPYSSSDLANNTTGIDVIVDGHAHLNIPSAFEKNKDGEEVIITSCGTNLESIGYITISTNGIVTASNTSVYPYISEENKNTIDAIVNNYSKELDAELFTNNCELSIKDENSIRIVRTRETGIGDLFADALRYYGEADLGAINGGGVRAGIPEGPVSYSKLIEIAPFDNHLAVIEVTGQELVDYFEYCYRNVQNEYAKNGEAYGEEGSFMQLSGIKLTVDTSVKSDITVDENDCFVCVNGDRRVKDVCVLENGEYVPIDLNKTYTLAGTDYSILLGGSGSANIFADNKTVLNSTALYSQVLIDYITDVLNGDISNYKVPQGRITIE